MTDVLHRAHISLTAVLTVRLQVVSANSGRPLHGRSVRLWRCDHPVEVRISDETGWTEFDGLLPPAGPGRWPHLHFEIHGHAGRLTLPGDAYATGALRPTDLAAFAAEAAEAADEPLTMASVTGDARRGLVATRTLAVS
jgi:protocatechuate 3,4-dioxygenase beta subunit